MTNPNVLPQYKFTLELCGSRIGVECYYESTREYCAGYLTEEPADFNISISVYDLRNEHLKSIKDAEAQGIPFRPTPPPLLEPLAVYRKIADLLLEQDVLLFHGSAISVDGEGYLFTAASGTGKSTHTAFWRQTFADRAVMVNDDKPLLRITEDAVYVCGTPWNGKHKLGTNIQVPLKGLCILERGAENRVTPIAPAQALPMLIQQSHRPGDPVKLLRVLKLVEKMSAITGLYRLECNLDPAAAMVAYNGMNRKENG